MLILETPSKNWKWNHTSGTLPVCALIFTANSEKELPLNKDEIAMETLLSPKMKKLIQRDQNVSGIRFMGL